ncbi:POTRA domain-containing protein [Thalassobellus suaedae]|uniref:POTRA domain-containing protein n=1 Tax=Thalassobellus suaedae TaxID=3074124 RepID=A0ABY9XQL8_9FLAO|nr:POTRA domain-containing protein [Flavobacteriaceae bacterium HL-DH14]
MIKPFYLFLIIYSLLSAKIYCQNFHLKVYGNSEYETQTIDSLNYLKTHFDFNSVKLEVDSIQKALYRIGYIEHKLTPIKKENDSTFIAHFHLKRKFNTIYIYYAKNSISTEILNLISKDVFEDYFIIKFSETESVLNFINSKISNQGLPFSKLKLSNIKALKNQTLTAELIIESNTRKRNISNIIIKGYEKFPRSYLKNYLNIKPNQSFNLSLIKKKTEQLNDLKFANQIKAPEVLFSKDSTSLYLYLEKAKSNSFDGFLGFGTNEETNNLEFDGYLNLNLTNNLNFGETFRLLYKSDENDQKTFDTHLTLPYIFKSPIGVDLQLRIFKRDSSFTTINQSAKLHYQINSKHKIYAGLLNLESNNLLTENTITNDIADYKTSYYSFAYEFIKQQSYNFLFPVNSKFYFEANFGKRKRIDESQKQSQFTIDAFKTFNLNLKNSIYIRVNSSTLISNTYLENELFRIGGINSIRGFEENSLLASSFGIINSEYRLQLTNSIYINSITDVAYFENKILNTRKKLFGYGFGFGILTKAGLLKFNYANGKLENQKFKLSNFKIHISITTDF